MALVENEYQQMSLWDPMFALSPRENEQLKKTWAWEFSKKIFPAISEIRFSVLFSGKPAKTNVPVNVLVGALILKDIFDLSDEELVENLIFDVRYQCALHTSSFQEQPIKTYTLENFRKKCYTYEKRTGRNLLAECFAEMEEEILKVRSMCLRLPEKDRRNENRGELVSHMRDFTNFEMLYHQVYRLVQALRQEAEGFVENLLLPYTEEQGDFLSSLNYTQVMEKFGQLMIDADRLSVSCAQEYEELPEYQLLVHTMRLCMDADQEKRTRPAKDKTKERTKANSGSGKRKKAEKK